MALTNAQLAQQIADLVEFFNGRESEFQAWLAGVAGGGPNSDGKYPLSDWAGNTRMTTSPAQLEEDVTSLVTGAAGSAAAAETARLAAVLARDGAQAAEALCLAYRDAAQESRDQAASSESAATNAATNATAAMNEARAAADSFLAKYLGAFLTDPVLDNDGNALIDGALYWNTGLEKLKVYSAGTWFITGDPGTYDPANVNITGGDINNIDLDGGEFSGGGTDTNPYAGEEAVPRGEARDIHGVPIEDVSPAENQLLQYRAGMWRPTPQENLVDGGNF